MNKLIRLILFISVNLGCMFIPVLIFPFIYVEYWKSMDFICLEGMTCLVDDFRSDVGLFILFFLPIVLIMVVNFMIYFKVQKRD